jgi:hypothetical protein
MFQCQAIALPSVDKQRACQKKNQSKLLKFMEGDELGPIADTDAARIRALLESPGWLPSWTVGCGLSWCRKTGELMAKKSGR